MQDRIHFSDLCLRAFAMGNAEGMAGASLLQRACKELAVQIHRFEFCDLPVYVQRRLASDTESHGIGEPLLARGSLRPFIILGWSEDREAVLCVSQYQVRFDADIETLSPLFSAAVT